MQSRQCASAQPPPHQNRRSVSRKTRLGTFASDVRRSTSHAPPAFSLPSLHAPPLRSKSLSLSAAHSSHGAITLSNPIIISLALSATLFGAGTTIAFQPRAEAARCTVFPGPSCHPTPPLSGHRSRESENASPNVLPDLCGMFPTSCVPGLYSGPRQRHYADLAGRQRWSEMGIHYPRGSFARFVRLILHGIP